MKAQLAGNSNYDGIRSFSNDSELIEFRRKEIIDKATRVFVKNGFHQTSMHHLAASCGMSIGMIYHYIGSKQDILYLIIKEAVHRPNDWQQTLEDNLKYSSPTEVLKYLIRQYYTGVDNTGDNTLFTYQETKNLDPEFRKTIMKAAAEDIKAIEKVLWAGVEKGEFKIANIPLMAHNVITLGHLWSVRKWFLGQVCTIEEYIEEQTSLILNSILVEKP
jgi:TetR/AcrR family transcriptional regulator, cholesterol catabolism regulator